MQNQVTPGGVLNFLVPSDQTRRPHDLNKEFESGLLD